MAENENLEENFAEMFEQQEAVQAKRLQPGQKIRGRIIAISGDDVFVDVGIKQDGVLARSEILDHEGKESAGIGDEVEAYVTGISSQGVRLARSMSGAGLAALEDAKDAALPVEGRVRAQVKGGYQVEVLGKTAFCPGSQMERADNPEDLVGRHMQFLITRIENHGRNIVVSRRALLERERQESLDKLVSSLKIGDIAHGRVTRLAPFGAFVEIAPQIEGMAHLSELSWSHISSAEEAVAVDDMIDVKILNMETDAKGRLRISLSRRQTLEDPWKDAESKFMRGAVVEGIVRRLAPFGAFVEIAPGIEGLVHLSEMSWEKRVNRSEDVLSQGERVQVAIKDINTEARRVSLSLKDALGDPWADAAENFAPGTNVSGVVESSSPHGLFIKLAPGITGLLPASVIKDAKNQALPGKLSVGDKVELVVQKLDEQARKISLAPFDPEKAAENEGSWRQHAKDAADASSEGMGIMAQALQKAMQRRKKGE